MKEAKTVLITGAGRGIGAETARQFARAGYNVVVHYYKSEAAARKLRAELIDEGLSAHIFGCDVRDAAAVSGMAAWARNNFGGADVLVNNAGVSAWGLFTDTAPEERRRVLDVNLHGVFNVTHAFLPKMIERKSGCIVNISSIWGVSGASCEAVYSASKAAVIGFTKALARETGPSGVRVNCIAPGLIKTGMNADFTKEEIGEFIAKTALNKIGKPADIAAAALFLAGDGARYMTGQVLCVDGGLF
ncbi:MAG: 3-oxoacyl-ACP reductase FabG [Clostridiales bacterium]|jgi:3-oxoacyl-[acyl-carrier protein] reductase|nr:3-oxoacyl-ACP reductase FabG [Clostridiales bacterium]